MGTNYSRVWHRCGTCGTIFSDIKELRTHQDSHQSKRNSPSESPATIADKLKPPQSVVATPIGGS